MSQQMGRWGHSTFRSLAGRNFRLWIGSSLLSNIGTWMQSTAQTWLVLTELAHHSAQAVGILTGLQFAPQLLLMAISGPTADRIDRRKLLIAIQSVQTVLALTLGLLVLTDAVRLWHVYLLALLLGCCMAFESPARHSFVSQLVDDDSIGNAVAINGTAFQLGRTLGPAIAGLCIAWLGTGWVFIINGLSYTPLIGGLLAMNVHEFFHQNGNGAAGVRLLDGFRYIRHRPDIQALCLMLFVTGALAFNFALFISVMAVGVYHRGAGEYGLLTTALAVGSVIGSLHVARRPSSRFTHVIGASTLLGCAMLLAATAPSYWWFGAMLLPTGFFLQAMNTSANGFIQLSTARAMRGRIMAIYVAIMLGGLPIGAPVIGWIIDRFGPRVAMSTGAAAALMAGIIGIAYLLRFRALRIARSGWRLNIRMTPDPHRPIAAAPVD